MKEENMKFWNSVCKTNPAETKEVKYPFKHTAIGAQYQIKHATEQWGIMGGKWGVKEEKFTPIMLDTEEKGFLIYTAILFYPDGEHPVHGDITFYSKAGNVHKVENDLSKKVATDALTKGLSKLGFNADVFEGLFDDNKYVQQMIKEFTAPPEKQKGEIAKAIKALEDCKNIPEFEKIKSLIDHRLWTEEETIKLNATMFAVYEFLK